MDIGITFQEHTAAAPFIIHVAVKPVEHVVVCDDIVLEVCGVFPPVVPCFIHMNALPVVVCYCVAYQYVIPVFKVHSCVLVVCNVVVDPDPGIVLVHINTVTRVVIFLCPVIVGYDIVLPDTEEIVTVVIYTAPCIVPDPVVSGGNCHRVLTIDARAPVAFFAVVADVIVIQYDLHVRFKIYPGIALPAVVGNVVSRNNY